VFFSLEKNSTPEQWKKALQPYLEAKVSHKLVGECIRRYQSLLESSTGFQDHLDIVFDHRQGLIKHAAPPLNCIKRATTCSLPTVLKLWIPQKCTICYSRNCNGAVVQPVPTPNKHGIVQPKCPQCKKFVHKRSFGDWRVKDELERVTNEPNLFLKITNALSFKTASFDSANPKCVDPLPNAVIIFIVHKIIYFSLILF